MVVRSRGDILRALSRFVAAAAHYPEGNGQLSPEKADQITYPSSSSRQQFRQTRRPHPGANPSRALPACRGHVPSFSGSSSFLRLPWVAKGLLGLSSGKFVLGARMRPLCLGDGVGVGV